jgi:hypothetical protein
MKYLKENSMQRPLHNKPNSFSFANLMSNYIRLKVPVAESFNKKLIPAILSQQPEY